MTFIYRKMNAALTPSQEALLGQIEKLQCPFEGIDRFKKLKLADLRSITGVSVVVTDKAHLVDLLEKSIEKMRMHITTSFTESRNDPEFGSRKFAETEKVISKRRNWVEEQLWRARNDNEVSLLGLYTRKLFWFDSAKPTVYLFADNINEYARRKGTNVDNVFAYVFIHEMMHAYYDAFYSEGFPSRDLLEEAFAEFGMLTFINKNNSSLPGYLLTDAIKHVESKIAPGPSEYGFGYAMFEKTGGGDPEMITSYMRISNKIDLEEFKNWKSDNKYFEDIMQYPKSVDADKCFEGVKEILDFGWKDPCFTIQPGIRGRWLSPFGGRPRLALPRLSEEENWAVTADQVGWCTHSPLIRTNDLVQLLEEILKVMKQEGLEPSLSFEGDRILFLGRTFSRYTTSARHIISESLCVKGSTVFPDFIMGLWGPSGNIGNILYALSILLDGTFSLIHEGSDFVLYGPEKCARLFSVAGKGFTIIEKSTSKILGTVKDMNNVPLFVIRDYCSKNPGVTLADLQNLFKAIHPHRLHRLNIVELIGKVPPQYEDRYFMGDAITLSTGDIIAVTREWTRNQDFKDFIIIAAWMGYIIKY